MEQLTPDVIGTLRDLGTSGAVILSIIIGIGALKHLMKEHRSERHEATTAFQKSLTDITVSHERIIDRLKEGIRDGFRDRDRGNGHES